MSGEVRGAAAVIGASDGGSDEGRGPSFVHSLAGGAGGCGDASDASGNASAGAAGTASGVAGNEVSALVSPSAVLSRCQRLGRTAWGSLMPVSGDMTSVTYWVNAETTRSKVLGSQSLSGVLRTAQAWGPSWGNASGVKSLSARLRNPGRLAAAGRCWRRADGRAGVAGAMREGGWGAAGAGHANARAGGLANPAPLSGGGFAARLGAAGYQRG